MRINPILEKELKVKMRGWKSPILITTYLFVLCMIIFFAFREIEKTSDFGPQAALDIYYVIVSLQFVLLSMITPALTATAISGEKERQTLDLLLCTEASAFSIVWGKLTASIAHVILLIIVSLPVLGTIFMFGGINLFDIIFVFIYYIVVCFFLASMGLFFSTIFKKNLTSIIFTYATSLIIYFGHYILLFITSIFYYSYFYGPSSFDDNIMGIIFMLSNPIIGFGLVLNPDAADYYFAGNVGVFIEIIPPWIYSCILYVILTYLLIRFSIYKINPLKGRRVGVKVIEETEENLGMNVDNIEIEEIEEVGKEGEILDKENPFSTK